MGRIVPLYPHTIFLEFIMKNCFADWELEMEERDIQQDEESRKIEDEFLRREYELD